MGKQHSKAQKGWECLPLLSFSPSLVFGGGRPTAHLRLPRTTFLPRSTVTDTDILRPQCPFPGTFKDTLNAFGALFFSKRVGGIQVGGALGRKEVPQPASGEIFPPFA